MKVNYKSDFELTIQLTAGGVDVAAPSWDWQLRFFTCDRQAVYTVAYIDGKAERCAVNSDGTITAYFDKHGLMPGALLCEFVNLVPDSHYTHDTQLQVDPVELGVELWRGASDGGMDAVTLELAGQVLAEVQALAADLQQKAESGYFDGEPGPQGPQGPPGPAGPGLLVVAVTGSDQEALTADHTAAEILAAHEAGRPVVAVYGGEVYQLASVGASLASFSLASADLDVLAQIDVDGDGGAVRIFEEVQGALTAGDGIVIDGPTISAVPEAFVVRMALPQTGGGGTADKEQADALAAYDAGKVVMVIASVNGVDYTFHAVMTAVWNYTATNRMLSCLLQRDALTGYRVTWHPGGMIIVEAYEPDRAPRLNSGKLITSGGVFTALQGKADTSALQNFCPIIEDTRSSAVATITGVAPFSELVDGQRIVLHFAYKSADSSTLTLTLSGGNTTATIPIYRQAYNNVSQLGFLNVRENAFYILIYQASVSRWWMVGCVDTNTMYGAITQEEITAGSSTSTRLVTPKLLVDNFDKRHLYVDNSADASVELSVATYNDLGTTDAPVVTLPAIYTAADEFLYCFTCATDNCVVTLPQGVVLADCCDDFSEVAAGVWFQVSIMDGVAAYLCVTPQN